MEARQAGRIMKIAVVGPPPECQEFVELAGRLQGPRVEVLGVAAPGRRAQALKWARERGILPARSIRQLCQLPGLELIVELTGEPKVREALARHKPPQVSLIERDHARLLAGIAGLQQAAGARPLAGRNFYQTVVNAIQDEIVVIGDDLRVIDANEAVFKRLGRPRQEVIGQPCYAVFQGREEPCEEPCPACQTFRSGRPAEAIKSLSEPGGRKTFFRVVSYPLRDATGAVSRVITIGRNVTERMQAEEALRESERRYRTLADNAVAGVFRTDLAGRLLYVNQALATLMGFESPEQALGRRVTDFYADPSQRARFVKQLKAQGNISCYEGRLRTLSGEVLTFLVSASLQGEVIEGVAVDITGRQRAEAELRQSEERYRRLIENIPDVTWTRDQEGKASFISANVERLYGYTPAEVCADPLGLWLGRIHPDDVERVKRAYARLFEQGQPYDVEYRIRHRDGRWLWLHDRSVATFERGGVRCASGLFTDITERKQTEHTLRESEEKFRALVESTPDWVWEVDLEGRYTYASPQVLDILGYEPREVLGRSFADFLASEEVARVRPLFEEVVERQGRLVALENVCRHRDGRPVVLETSAVPVFDAAGRLKGYRGIDRDISERKRTEEALRQSEGRYRALVDNALVGVFRCTWEGEILYANQAALSLMGFERPEEVLGRKDIEFYVNPARREEIRAKLEATGQVCGEEVELRTKQGATRSVMLSISMRDGVAEGMISDFTGRKKAEEALRESEANYRTIFNAANDAIFVHDPETGAILDVNEKACEMYGYSREELVRLPFDMTDAGQPPYSRREALEWLRMAANGEPQLFEWLSKDRSGRLFWTEVSLKRVLIGDRLRVLAVVRDITERKKAEEALRESEERFRNLMDHVPGIAIQGYGTDGTVFYWNRVSERIYGWRSEEAIGRNLAELIVPPGLKPLFEECLAIAAQVKESGEFMPAGELLLLHKDGSPVPVYSIHTAVCLEGRPPLLFCIDVDLSERKKAEEALRIKDSAIASSISAMAMADLDGRLTYVNRSFLRLWGYEDEREVLGRCATDFWRLEDKALEVVKIVRERGSWVGELIATRKDGTSFDAQLMASVATDPAGQPICLMASFVDITERKRAAEALCRSETLLRNIFSAIPDLLTIHDRNFKVVLSNWHGHDFIPEEVRRGRPKCYEAYMQRGEPCEPCPAHAVFDTGEPTSFEVTNPVDGLRREVNVYPIFDETGQVVMVAEHIRDVTERHRAERRLIEETRFTEGIVDGCPVAMFVVGRDHKLVYWNRACEELTGLSRQEMLGTDRQWEPWYFQKRPVMADLVVDGDVAGLQKLYAHQGLAPAPFVKDAYKGEGYFEKLGRHLYFLAAPVYGENGEVLGAIETVQDVTETKRLEDRLQQYSRTLERTIEELETKTRKLEAQEASQRAYSELLKILNSIDINQILRRSLQRIVEQANCQLGLIYLRENPEAELRLMAAYSVDAGALDSPILQPGGGLPAKVAQEGRPVTIREVSPEARLSFYLGFARATPRTIAGLPITFRDQVLGSLVVASLESLEGETIAFLENCLRQVAVAINNALSFAQIERQSQELADINRELAEASRLKSEFVANMSHELRTPLNSILGFSDILLKNKEGNLTERQLANIEKIRRNGANLLNLINSILNLSKAEAGKMEAAQEPTNVRQVVEECVESVRPLADKSGLELVLEPVDELPIIRSDQAKIGQILMNLLSNAIKFTEEGRVTVKVRKRRRREDPIEIAVEDTGIGIPPQHLEDIFKEFKQLDGSADRRYGGTGLGLTISRRLAQLLGGDILVESEVGRGSTFTLRLPVVSHEEPALIPSKGPLVAALSRPRLLPGRKLVLLIGADADAAQLAEAEAEQLGCELSVCASAQEGLKRAAEMAPDAVLLDLAVPDRNGWEVLGELKSKEGTRDLPVVAVSGPDDRKRAFYLGATEFVAKPLEAEQLRSTLAKVLRPGRGRILVVDDEPEYLEAIREWLGDAVGEICPARNGVEALRQLEARRPDAIFLDLMMPQMDGFEFLKQVRSLEGCADIPVVVVTGKQLGDSELARIQDGSTSVIQKGLTAQAQVMQQLERIVSRLH